ncbi:MAG: aspartate aminotransferase family protein [Burkholderiaceae bacterium]
MNMSSTNTASRSSRLYERAQRVFPGGYTRVTLIEKSSEPVFVDRGEGAYMVSVDGRRYLDCSQNFTSLIHGHAFAPVTQAVREQLEKGTAFSLGGEAEIRLAEALQQRCRSFEHICFSNSGTEAVMHALKASRAFTGRPLIAKCEGAYHGLSDFSEVSVSPTPDNWGDDEPASVPSSAGTPESVLDGVVTLPFNDVQASLGILQRHRDRLACVLLDPMPSRLGLIPATAEYLRAIREFCTREGVVLVFDQVINFRLAHGGCEAFFGVEPDVSTLAKVVGGGFPIGAVAGRASFMKVFSAAEGYPKLPSGGTFSANPVTMLAGLAALEHLTPAAIDRINQHGENVRSRVTAHIERQGLEACITGEGSLFKIHFGVKSPRNYRDSFPLPAEVDRGNRFRGATMARNVHLMPSGLGSISTVMTEADIETLVTAMRESIDEVYADS